MEHVLALECRQCGRQFDPDEGYHRCPDHAEGGGSLAVFYDDRQVAGDVELPTKPIESVWRYADLLPVPADGKPVTLGEGGTTLADADQLGGTLDVDLSLKLECTNPTGSTKDRGSSVVATYAKATGYRGVVCASTGNAAASMATYAARAGLDCLVFIPAATPKVKATQPLVAGADVVAVEGSYDDAVSLARSVAGSDDWLDRSAGATPYTALGSRTLGYELAEEAATADWVVAPVGNGGTIAGIWDGLSLFQRCGFLDATPRLLGVQADGSNAVVASHDGNETPAEAGTCADSIDVSNPREADAARQALRESDGAAVSVADEDILAAQRRLGTAEGVFAEPASAATLAGLEAARESGPVAAGDSVVLVITGTGLKDTATASRVAADRVTVPPDLDRLELAERLGAQL